MYWLFSMASRRNSFSRRQYEEIFVLHSIDERRSITYGVYSWRRVQFMLCFWDSRVGKDRLLFEKEDRDWSYRYSAWMRLNKGIFTFCIRCGGEFMLFDQTDLKSFI